MIRRLIRYHQNEIKSPIIRKIYPKHKFQDQRLNILETQKENILQLLIACILLYKERLML